MKPIDRLGFGPTRTVLQTGDTFAVTVTPPAFMGKKGCTVILDFDQYERYLQWRDGGVLIQDVLADISDDEREILMTGLGPEEFAEMAAESEDD